MYIPSQKYIHFIGIGGIGMSGIAEVLLNLGYKVQGSDIASNNNTKRLEKLGVRIFITHHAPHVENAQVVVISSAISLDNPELCHALHLGIPVIQRAEMLAELMRLKKSVAISGTHGKTTTTSLMASLFEAASLDPTVVNGGIINAYGTNARLGSSEWIIVEADESDGSFVKLSPTMSVVTNIDPEHMEFYKTEENLFNYFLKFIKNVPFYGSSILCYDHDRVRDLISHMKGRRFITYGFHKDAMIRALNISTHVPTHEPNAFSWGTTFDVQINESSLKENTLPFKRWIRDLNLPLLGEHNIQNALAVIGVALEMGFSDTIIRSAFSSFKGVKRRFTHVGSVNGALIIDDYAHHPVEIQTVIKSAQSLNPSRIISVFQPHRYTRVRDLFEAFAHCFEGSHTVIVSPVYAANEAPIEGVSAHDLVKAIQHTQTCPNVIEIADFDELCLLLKDLLAPNDIVLFMGAGTITNWANLTPERIEDQVNKSIFSLNSNNIQSKVG